MKVYMVWDILWEGASIDIEESLLGVYATLPAAKRYLKSFLKKHNLDHYETSPGIYGSAINKRTWFIIQPRTVGK